MVNTHAQKVFLLEQGELAFQGTPSALFDFIQGYDRLDTPSVIKVAQKLKEKGMNIDPKQIHSIPDLVNAIKEGRKKA